LAKLIYSTTTSLDGFIEDASGSIDWTAPDDEVHAYINERLRPVGTYLLGRRSYETMVVWETMSTADAPPGMRDYAAIWRATEKIVYSTTLRDVASADTRLERHFDVDTVRAMKDAAARDLAVGGAALAAEAIRAGLVDELYAYLAPVVLGGGKPWLPEQVRLRLDLLDERRFANGVVYLRYAIR
jgi:dihydrofolate reductase